MVLHLAVLCGWYLGTSGAGPVSPATTGPLSVALKSRAPAPPPLIQPEVTPDLPVLAAPDSLPPLDALDWQGAPVPATPDLNPVPRLNSQVPMQPAMLSLRHPMAEEHRADLEAALNHWEQQLPRWTEGEQPLRWRDGEREYQAEVDFQPADSPDSLERAMLTVRTSVDGLPLAAKVPVTRVAFSHYAQLVDRWNPEVSLAGDHIEGRLHSNTEVFVESNGKQWPQVSGPTTVAGRVTIKRAGYREQVFSGGLTTRSRRIPLPADPLPWRELSLGAEQLLVVEADSRVDFDAAGHVRVSSISGEQPPRSRPLPDAPLLIAAEDGVKLEVQGVVRGSVVVYSPERLVITGELRYARDPLEHGNSPDFLGLVSDRYVDVAPPEVTGPGDLRIEGAIYAKRRFQIRSFRARPGAELSIYGSLTAGSMSATEPRYSTRLVFDPRLEERRPPFFPMTGQFRLDGVALAWEILPDR